MSDEKKVLRFRHAKLKLQDGRNGILVIHPSEIRGYVTASTWTELIINGGFIPVLATATEIDQMLGWQPDQGGSKTDGT